MVFQYYQYTDILVLFWWYCSTISGDFLVYCGCYGDVPVVLEVFQWCSRVFQLCSRTISVVIFLCTLDVMAMFQFSGDVPVVLGCSINVAVLSMF